MRQIALPGRGSRLTPGSRTRRLSTKYLPSLTFRLAPAGTGLREFHPLVIALASGANFIARGFSGDPNGVAALIAEAVRHPGFSFVEVLSPCVTFRPEQREWKQAVRPAPVAPTDDPARAARRLMTDDGFNIGVLYKGNRPPLADASGKANQPVEDLECQFRL